MKLSPSRLLSSLALAALLTWFICWHPLSWDGPTQPCHLVLQVISQGPTRLSVRLDEGHGIDDTRASDLAVDLPADSVAHNLTIPLPPQRLRALRISFSSTPAVVITGARLTFEQRAPIDFLAQLQSGASTVSKSIDAGRLFQPDPRIPAVQSVPPLPTVTIDWQPIHPIDLPAGDEPSVPEAITTLAGFTVLVLLLHWSYDRLRLTPTWEKLHSSRLSTALTNRPVLSLASVGLCAAALSSYPVIFCHKSFVSPTTFPYLLYSGNPTLPGLPKEPAQNTKGSDIAATMVYSLPNSALVSDALFRDHELPFWNRYVSAGLPLFAQGQSMLGNPLHFLAIAANGASWAWDLKFLIAKALFSFGIGLCLWLLRCRLGVSALLGASAAWIGFFAYRMNHPAFFSLCFAPWILVPWLGAVTAKSRRSLLAVVFGLIVADWCELTSGTAKEASMILIFMNLAGILAVGFSQGDWSSRLRRLAVLFAASFSFLLLSAPQWLLFLDALKHGESWYTTPVVYQLPPGLLVGFFDDIFSQDFTPLEVHSHPSANSLVLTGVLWLFSGGVNKQRRASVVALVCAAIPLAALVFGVIPPEWIKVTPFLANIYHVHNTFGVPLIILLLFLAGLGLDECLDQIASPRWTSTYWRMVVSLICLLALYLGYTQATPPPLLPSFNSEPLWHSYFFLGYSSALILAVFLFPWALRWFHRRNPDRISGFCCLGVCLFLLHFRHGMYIRTRFDDYVMTPRMAADLTVPSPALERIRHIASEPYRTAGIDLTFSPDYNALVRLEGISNIDAFSNPYFDALVRAARIPNTSGARLVLPEPALPTLKPVLDFLNLRYYLREPKPGQKPLTTLSLIGVDDLEVYESPQAWPRAFFTDQVRHYHDVADLVSMIQHGDGRPFAAMQDNQSDSAPSAFSERKIVPAGIYRHTTNSTEFTVDAPTAGVIVLAEAFEPENFRVTLNGAPVTDLRINHTFKGVHIDTPGPCHLRFEYRPHLLVTSLWLSAAGALIGILLIAFIVRQPIAFFEPH